MVQPANKRLVTEESLGVAVNAEAALARNADNLTSGTVADARIPSSIARDAEVTAAVAAEAALARDASNLTSGTINDARIPASIARDSEVTAAVAAEAALARDASNLTSGTVADARIASTIARDSEVSAAVAAEAAIARNADNLTSGTIPDARISSAIARVDSPAFSGNPTAPTPTYPDLGTKLATTQYVADAIGGISGYTAVIDRLYYSASGTFNKADYPTAKKILVRLVGGGGAGGGTTAATATTAAAGTGGGGGGYSEKLIDLEDLAASETVTIGAGGIGVTGNTGGTGGTTSFGTHLQATGGTGGLAGSDVGFSGGAFIVSSNSPGVGGVGSLGDLNVPGGDGTMGGAYFSTGVLAGSGGASMMSAANAGQKRFSATANGEVGNDFGGGGWGAVTVASGAGRAGGNGAPGLVIIDVLG